MVLLDLSTVSMGASAVAAGNNHIWGGPTWESRKSRKMPRRKVDGVYREGIAGPRTGGTRILQSSVKQYPLWPTTEELSDSVTQGTEELTPSECTGTEIILIRTISALERILTLTYNVSVLIGKLARWMKRL